jgi:hypothetical protein
MPAVVMSGDKHQARMEPPSTVITVPVAKLCVMQNR